MSDACKLLKEKEQLVLQFKAANEKKNEFLKKIGIYATGEFHRIDYYIDKLVAENDRLKRYKDSKQASYESMQREWNKAVNENRELKAENDYLKLKISHYENLLKQDFTKSRTAEEVVQHANYLREQGRIVLIEENQKLKTTLTEIKEIVKPVEEIYPFCGLILEIISEVEDA